MQLFKIYVCPRGRFIQLRPRLNVSLRRVKNFVAINAGNKNERTLEHYFFYHMRSSWEPSTNSIPDCWDWTGDFCCICCEASCSVKSITAFSGLSYLELTCRAWKHLLEGHSAKDHGWKWSSKFRTNLMPRHLFFLLPKLTNLNNTLTCQYLLI